MHKNQGENFAARKQRKREKRTRFSPKKAKPGAFWVLEGMGTVENGSNQMRKPRVRTKTNPKTMQHMQKENRQKPRVSAGFLAGAEGLSLGCRLGCCSPVGSAQHRPRREPRPAQQSATGARSPHDTHCAGAQPCLVAESLCALTKNREASTMLASLFLAGAEGLSLAGRLGRFAAERHWRSLTPRHAVLEWMWEQTTRSGRGPVSPGSCRKPERGRCCELFLEKDCVSTTTSSFERKAPPPGGWPS